MKQEEACKILDDALAKLAEHFDAIQILTSRRSEDGGTVGTKRGIGDWYARQGMAHEFIEQDKANELSCQISEKLDPPDDSDSWKKTS